MDKVHDTLIKRKTEILQENLVTLRKLANWSATSLAARLGVTKQNISLIENLKNHLTQTQYIAIRTLFDRHIMDHRYNIYLPMALYYLLDNPSTSQVNQDKKEVFSLLVSQIYGQPLFDYAKDSTKKLLQMVEITIEDKFLRVFTKLLIAKFYSHEKR